jgi:hypothetical protein
MSEQVVFVPYKQNMYNTLRRPTGMVGRHMGRRSVEFIAAARAQVGKGTGQLAKSIHVRHHRAESYGQEMKIGSTVKHAYLHHEGTRPHIIRPKDADNGILVFRKGARMIATREVRHPGTRPNRYLTNNLQLFVRP